MPRTSAKPGEPLTPGRTAPLGAGSGRAEPARSRAVRPGQPFDSARPERATGDAGRESRGSRRSALVQLAWALDREGRKVHVARVDPKDRRARGPFTCPACGEPLVPHLGALRARHFAHLPGSTCPLTAPETALHLDAKERLLALCADAFAGVRRVTILARCPSCRRLAPRDLAEEGDGAEPEGAVGPLRADVLVTRAGVPRLALEVLVTHAVEPEKEAALSAAGVPAVEVDAREEWEEQDEGGVRIAVARSLGFPPCPACAAQARADADRGRGGEAAEIAELESYRARGLFGPAPRRASGAAAGSAPVGGKNDGATSGADAPEAARPGDRPLDAAERASLAARFSCPECGGTPIAFGERLARHACPGKAARPIAWRGYDGAIVELSWWRRRGG